MTRAEDQAASLRKIGEMARDARLAAGLSQEQVAKRIGMARSSVANLEAGRQDMNITRLAGIAAVLGLDLNEVIGLVKLPSEPPAPHEVRVQRVWEADCLTCGAELGWSADRAEVLERKRAHIKAAPKGEPA